MPEFGPLGGLIPNPANAFSRIYNNAHRKSEFADLREDQNMRSDAPLSEQAYSGYTHEKLHEMVTEDLDTETADTAGDVVNEIGNWLSDVGAEMRNAVQQEQVEWQGEAANKAHGLFDANADWAEGTRDAAWLVSNRYKEQAETAGNARSRMPEPTHFDMAAELDKGVAKVASGDLSGAADVFSGIPEKQEEADEKHAEAVQVMHDMDNSYHRTASSQPMFVKPPEPGDSGSTDTSAAGYISAADSGGATGPGSVGTGNSGGAMSGAGNSGTPGGPGGVGAGTSGGPGTAGKNYSATGPVGASTNAGGPGGGTGPSTGSTTARPGSGGLAAPLGAAGGSAGTGSGAPPRGAGRGGAPHSAGSAAAPRANSGAGSAGERSAAGRATGSETGGSGKSAVSRGGAAAARAAESSGQGGRPMAGAPGAGRGGNSDDEEHQRKYEITEDDPDEIFGNDAEYTENGQRVVPPVIGG